MATSEHSTSPCALCGLGGPEQSKPTGICGTCLNLIELSDDAKLVRDPELRRKVLLVPVKSDNIAYAGWRAVDARVGILLLQFHGKATVFRYVNVRHDWWLAFLTAESKGSFFHQSVRADVAAHPFTKL